MQVEHINPFIGALTNAFETMLGTSDITRGKLTIGDPSVRTYPISGIIGLSGGAVGTVVINLSEQVALSAASTLLMEEKTEVDEDVLDAVGELANVVAGQAKADLEEYNLSISLPSVIRGEGHSIHFPGTQPLSLPFETSLGPFKLEVGFEYQSAEVAAV